jgi:biopolymer transport protein TolR
MGMSVGGAGQTSVKSEPNVVPMIDIMLVLLIIFMIVTPLIAAGFKATLPKGANLDNRPEGENEIVMGIDADGNYFLDGKPIPADVLLEQLKAMYAARTEDKIIYFKADQNLPYEKVEAGVEIARQAGARVLSAIVDKQGGGMFEKPKPEDK